MRLTFEEPEPGVTIVKLTQTDVPEEDRLVWFLVDEIVFLFFIFYVAVILT